MKYLTKYYISIIILGFHTNLWSQANYMEIEKALMILESNKHVLENVGQILVVYNEKQEHFNAVFMAFEKIENSWIVKQEPIMAGIGKNGFASPTLKLEGDGKTPTGIYKLGKLFSYEKQQQTLLENQQITKEDKWIDDVHSADYNKHIIGETNAKSYENLLLKNDGYKYCIVIEYNTNPVVRGKGSAIFFHLALNPNSFTLGCVAISEEYMKLMINWLDPQKSPAIIMGNLEVLKAGL